jgi:ubiquinone/menaquinone biosynthesis C-methylase UbiE
VERSKLAQRYVGNVAAEYDARRSSKTKWRRELAAIDLLLQTIPAGASLLDVPVGTGRFLEICKRRELRVTGIDSSEDMLNGARNKARQLSLEVELKQGSIFELAFADNSFDCVLSIRILNWFSIADVRVALTELSRTSRKHVIVSVRTFPENQSALERLLSLADTVRRKLLLGKWGRPQTTIHRKEDILAAFHAAHLNVSTSIPILSRPYGTHFEIYLLSKTAK